MHLSGLRACDRGCERVGFSEIGYTEELITISPNGPNKPNDRTEELIDNALIVGEKEHQEAGEDESVERRAAEHTHK